MDYPVILFYKYVELPDPGGLVQAQRTLCESLGLKGRVLIAHEGINGTLSGQAHAIEKYVCELRSGPGFGDIEIKTSPGHEDSFPKLVVKLRPEIVTLGVPELKPDLDNQLSPAEWKRMIEQEDVVLVDVRNRYESAVGQFENAWACDIAHFRELPDYVKKLDELKDKKVLMYCTGGIRCEKASALFRSRGFKNVFQLHGGIVTYLQEFGNEHWLGDCFVFDQRMTVRVEEGFVPAGVCAHTGRPTSRFVNCLHDPCHALFLLDARAEDEEPQRKLCPQCREAGLDLETAEYIRSSADVAGS